MTRTLRVLISEDREDDALLVVDELRQSGFNVGWRRVETPDEMRSLLQAQDWDLVIADYDLPRFSAMGALKMIKESGRDIPFLIVSGAMREIDAVAGMRAGVHDYLLKGNLTRLGAVVERELREAEVRGQRRAAESMLRRQAQVLDQVHDAVIQMDLEGSIQKWNRGAEQLFGYTQAEAIFRPIIMLCFAEDAGAFIPHMVATLQREQRFDREMRMRHKSGEARWIRLSMSILHDEDGAPYGTVCYSQDVTEHRRAEAALRSSEERYRSLTEALPQMVYVAHDGAYPPRIEFCNAQVLSYTGLTAEQLRNGSWQMLVHPEDQDRVAHATTEAHRAGTSFEVHCRLRRASDGAWRWHLARSVSFREPDGTLRWLSTIIDVEDQTRAADALRRTEKLAAVGRLASSIAHEINNPLEAVTNLVYLLQSTSLDAEQRAYLNAASEELARVSHITSHTLRFHRQSTQATDVDLAELLDSVLALYQARLKGSSIHIERRYKTTEPICGYSSELRQVFANLVGNAFDATRRGGKVVLAVRHATHPRNGDEGIRVTIADSGHGMSRETRRRIFEPFFTTKGINGTGLGLWVSLGIVEKHGGMVSVRSSEAPPVTGTIMSLFFPFQPRHRVESSVGSYPAFEGLQNTDGTPLPLLITSQPN